MSAATTRGIRVRVESSYVEERSSPAERHYFFAYHVRIENVGEEGAQLLARRWVITDSDGNQEIVEGPGVVGEQPSLAPGEAFEYTSFCPLPTAVGTMHGTYHMVSDAGELFTAEIAPFTLAVPHAVN